MMAVFQQNKRPKPKRYDKFFGLNESIGETSLKDGEAVVQENWRITENFELQKRSGYETFKDFSNSKPVVDLWAGWLNDQYEVIMYVVLDSEAAGVQTLRIYRYMISTAVLTDLGTIARKKRSQFIVSNGYLYYKTDYAPSIPSDNFKNVPATGSALVAPSFYVPTIRYGCTPSLSTAPTFEEFNILSSNYWIQYIGDGTSTDYYFYANVYSVTSVVSVYVNGVLKTLTTDYTVPTVGGQLIVRFNTAPALNDSVFIRLQKSTVPTIFGYFGLCNVYGKGDDTRYFFYGTNDVYLTDFIYYTASNNILYIPETNYLRIGQSGADVTALVNQYEKMIIFTENGAFRTETTYNEITSRNEFPVFRLNETIGCTGKGQGELINNRPVTLFKNSIRVWNPSDVRTEINESDISGRVKETLNALDLDDAVTFDNTQLSEYWIATPTKIIVWNYKNDTFYVYTGIKAYCLFEYNKEVYFGSDGKVYKFGGDNDDTIAVSATCELCFTDFDIANLYKNSRKLFITIKPYDRTSLEIEFETDRKSGEIGANNPIEYALLYYSELDYGDWTYDTNINLQRFRRRFRAKKYSFIKLILKNSELDEPVVVLQLDIEAETSGEVKN